MTSFDVLAYRLFGKFSKRYVDGLAELNSNLKRAGMNYIVEEWLSVMILSAIIATGVSFVGLFFILLSTSRTLLLSLISSVVLSLFVGGGIAFGLYAYPGQVIGNRRKRIENSLHFAAIYMSTLAGTGIPPYKIFNVLKKFKEFGEVSKIAEKISRDLDVFGLDLNDALERAALSSPAKNLKDLLWGMRATIVTGGNLREYLEQRAKALTNEYRRKLESYVKTLSLFLEIYITVVIVGSVFALVLTTIMSILGGSGEQVKIMQMILVTIVLPASSIVFIVILKTMNPTEV